MHPCRPIDYEYSTLVRHVLEYGTRRPNRTGVDALSVFGYQYRVDLEQGFPMLTTKKLHWRSIVGELLWFLRGRTDVAWLEERGITIWREWAKEDGTIGPGYGSQMRCWESKVGLPIDQITQVVQSIKTDPHSRRHVVSMWNVDDLSKMALAPCHMIFQFYVSDGRLSCHLTQRSCDVGLGLCYNTASYALLTHLMAAECGLGVGEFVHSIGDVHVYVNHVDALRMQLDRTPFKSPTLAPFTIKTLDQYEIEDLSLIDYQAHPSIKMEVAV